MECMKSVHIVQLHLFEVWGLLKRIDYPKQICLAYFFLFNVFTALKGTHFYILFVSFMGLDKRGP